MARPKKPLGPLAAFIRLLWRQPLMAIPFAIFFAIVRGRFPADLLPAYLISLIFAFCIGLTLWAVEHILFRQSKDPDAKPITMKRQVITYSIASMGASMLAALIVDLTLIPGFVRNSQSFAMIVMFSLLFCALFMAINLAIAFYGDVVKKAKSEQELTLARRIQQSFLLSNFPERPRLEVHAVNVSSLQVSGDFYDVVNAGDDAFLVAIADVAGKGVGAALLSSMLQASLRTQAAGTPSVAAILRNINALVYRSTAVNQFATFFLARVDERRLELSFTNAGHNYPLLFRRSGERSTLERGGTVVGILEEVTFEEETVALRPGDRIVLYTDGISEAANAASELYGEERLIALIEAQPPGLSARELTERILEGVRGFLDGEEAGDDMTILVLRVLDPVSEPIADGRTTPSRETASAQR